MSTWNKTDLSMSYVDDTGRLRYEWEMGQKDRETFPVDAEEAISGATATIIDLETRKSAGTIEGPAIAGNIASFTVSGLSREANYELAVTFTATGGRKWTRTLVIPCVA